MCHRLRVRVRGRVCVCVCACAVDGEAADRAIAGVACRFQLNNSAPSGKIIAYLDKCPVHIGTAFGKDGQHQSVT